MGRSVRVQVKKELWYWALEEAQKDEGEISDRFPKFRDWVNGETNPTFKQLEHFANYLKIPFGYMFLETPPKDNVMEVEFRSIKNKLPAISKNLKDTLTEMDVKKSWMSDYRRSLGWDKLNIIVNFNKLKQQNISANANLAKKLLDLESNWYESAGDLREAYNFLKNKIENTGILVMQNGIVGMNTRRKLDINEFRAFMLFDEISPLIFINNTDSQGGKIFSLIHEYFHVLFEKENLFLNEDLYKTTESESFINQLTAEFLMPQQHILMLWNKNLEPMEQVVKLSNIFKVSETALAIRLNDMFLINDQALAKIIKESSRNFERRTTEGQRSGGDFYNTFNARVSPVFTEAVIRSTEMGEIGYTYAFRLLGGIKGRVYDEIKERTMRYD